MPMNRNELCEQDFAYFVRHVLNGKIGRMHREIIERLHRSHRHLHVQAHRGAFKTTILSIYFPIWLAWKTGKDEKKLNIGIVSHSLNRSSEIMRLLKEKIIALPEVAVRLYPKDIHHAIWSATEIVTENGHRLVCVPPGGVQGEHFDLLILDDIQRDEDGTGSGLENLKRVFWQVIFPVINARKGKLLVVGTPLSYNDLYSEIKENVAFEFLSYPAVVVNQMNGEWMYSSFPEHYSVSDLRAIQEALPTWAWQSQYMLNPIGANTGLFPYELVKVCVIEQKELDTVSDTSDVDANSALSFKPYYMGCDIALSADSKADRSCFFVVRRIKDTVYVVYKHIPARGTASEEQVAKIKELAKVYNCSRVVIEQKGLGYSLAEKAHKEIPCVEKFDTNRGNKEQIIGNLELLMRNGKFKMVRDDALVNELLSFGLRRKADGSETFEALSGHDDQVMALALACHAAGGWTAKAYVPVTAVLI